MKGPGKTFGASFLQSRLVLAVLLCLSFISVLRLANEVSRRMAFTKEINRLQQQTAEMRKQSTSLSQLIQYLSSDAYIESEAREKLTLRKQGERVIIVGGESTTTAYLNDNAGLASTSFEAWWNYFFSDAK